MFELMLRPMGVSQKPSSVPEAVEAYVEARNVLEQRFGMNVPRVLEREVRPALE
jgi:hypothetical protein